MCVIIIKQKGQQLAKGVLKNAARINPHGLGVVWLDTFQVEYYESKKHAVLKTDRPFIAHFRYATIGAINQENTHPFRCGNNKNEWLMMNGTIQALGNAKNSDTKVLAGMLGAMPRHTWKKELERYNCRFVTINTHNRTYQVYNQDLWVQQNGVWYSKDNVLSDNLVAVYGTLRKNNSNYYSYLLGQQHVGTGKTVDKYPLIINGLPYLIEEKGVGHNVVVDVFRVSDSVLKNLDQLENHPNWYERKEVDVKMGKSKKTLKCWVYFNPKTSWKGQALHEEYIQTYKRKSEVSTWSEFEAESNWSKRIAKTKAAKRPDPKFHYHYDEHDMVDNDSDFDRKNEKPICICCYNDLKHDGHSNYHCSGCGGWFTESEVITM
jgi:gamma-glutamylaminecyclotransferase